MTVATALSTKFNRTITPDYVGDDGYDLEYNGRKIEVKTVTRNDDTELKIPPKQAEIADYVVLTRCTSPNELVQIIGWAPTSHLNAFGYRFSSQDLIRLDANYLIPFEPLYLSPDQIRTSQQI